MEHSYGYSFQSSLPYLVIFRFFIFYFVVKHCVNRVFASAFTLSFLQLFKLVHLLLCTTTVVAVGICWKMWGKSCSTRYPIYRHGILLTTVRHARCVYGSFTIVLAMCLNMYQCVAFLFSIANREFIGIYYGDT